MEKYVKLTLKDGNSIEMLVDTEEGEILQFVDPITGSITCCSDQISRNWDGFDEFMEILELRNDVPPWSFLLEGNDYNMQPKPSIRSQIIKLNRSLREQISGVTKISHYWGEHSNMTVAWVDKMPNTNKPGWMFVGYTDELIKNS